jgi:Amt family ammonium transporter
MEGETLTSMFQSEDEGESWCFNYSSCTFKYAACHLESVRPYLRYTSASAAWVLLCSIIVFFMKAGFMLLELSFATSVPERRHVVILKHQDAFASAFGFFLIGFYITGYSSPQDVPTSFFHITDPILWFFKFTFASNAATVLGGVLVTNTYKLRLPAAFLSAFVISGVIHPLIARLIWSDKCESLSPYRFCSNSTDSSACNYGCSQSLGLRQRMYVLDFAGGGAVHMLGGIAGLVICVLAKLQGYMDRHCAGAERWWRYIVAPPCPQHRRIHDEAERGEEVAPRNFLEWMYPVSGGEESVSDAALGVVILWFCWFAFNCGSTESVQVGIEEMRMVDSDEIYYPYYGISATIAVNMIMSAASGGTLAVIIAVWAQVYAVV